MMRIEDLLRTKLAFLVDQFGFVVVRDEQPNSDPGRGLIVLRRRNNDLVLSIDHGETSLELVTNGRGNTIRRYSIDILLQFLDGVVRSNGYVSEENISDLQKLFPQLVEALEGDERADTLEKLGALCEKRADRLFGPLE